MRFSNGILIFGANGSGKSTLGRELACVMGYKYMDIEDYHFGISEIPYTKERTKEERDRLIMADIKTYNDFIISVVTGDFCDEITDKIDLAICLYAPLDIRLERIKNRAIEKYGDRVCDGGDMYENQNKFYNFVASRSTDNIDAFAKTLTCPVIYLDGTKPIDELVKEVEDDLKGIT